jgi:hypothetical protein
MTDPRTENSTSHTIGQLYPTRAADWLSPQQQEVILRGLNGPTHTERTNALVMLGGVTGLPIPMSDVVVVQRVRMVHASGVAVSPAELAADLRSLASSMQPSTPARRRFLADLHASAVGLDVLDAGGGNEQFSIAFAGLAQAVQKCDDDDLSFAMLTLTANFVPLPLESSAEAVMLNCLHHGVIASGRIGGGR